MPTSAGANPLPVTVTTVPTAPEVGLSMIVGAEAVTVNLASAIWPVTAPVISMSYVPVGTLPTVNVKGDSTPVPENVHAAGAVTTPGVGLEICGQGAKKAPASAESKPLPLTVTMVPTGPNVGLSVIEGPVTVSVAWATSPEEPVNMIEYGPGTVVGVIVNVKGSNTPLLRIWHVPGLLIIAGVELESSGEQPTKMPASELSKPLPETVTTVPPGPEVGFSVIIGPVTVKTAWPISPAGLPST